MALVFRGKRFLSVPEAADRLRVTRVTVYRWIHGVRAAPGSVMLRDVIEDTRTRRAYIPEAVVQRLRRVLRRSFARGRKRRRP